MESAEDLSDLLKNKNFRALYNIFLRKTQQKIQKAPLVCWNKPTSVQVDVTTKCMLGCEDCPRNLLKGTDVVNKDMSIETFKRIAPIFPYLQFVWLHSYGEPLMNENFIELLRIAKGTGVRTFFYTNGMLLDERKAMEIVKLRADKVIFSFDGATKETFEKIRTYSDFGRVINNLAGLEKIKRDLSSDKPNIEMSFAIRKDNIHEMSAMVDLAKSQGIRKVFFQNVIAYTSSGNEQSIYKLDKAYVRDIFDKTKKRAKELKIRIRLPEIEKIKRTLCYHPWATMHIRVDGRVTPCPYCAYPFEVYFFIDSQGELVNKKVPFCQHILGDVNKADIFKIWNSRAYQSLRKTFQDDDLREPHNKCIMPYNIH